MEKIETSNLTTKTFVVTYEDGSKDMVKPVSWKALEDLQLLQYNILENAAKCGGSVGDILNPSNKDFWNSATKLAKLLPVVGNEEKGIDLDKIEDMDLLVKIFITNTTYRDPESGFIAPDPKDSTLRPSEISRINGLNFFKLLMKIQTEIQERMKNTSQT